jgi:hypothetical protein
MIVDFWSSWIGVHNSSGSAEIYTLSQVLHRAMHVKYIGEEMGLIMPKIITVYVDATVAIAFAADIGNPAGMKFIDLRQGWVIVMRNKSICKAIKVDTADNPSDFGTKILNTAEFKRQRRYFLRTPRYSRSKTIRGDLAKMQNVQVGSVTCMCQYGYYQQGNGHYADVDWIWSCNLKYSGSITEGACKHKGKISQIL